MVTSLYPCRHRDVGKHCVCAKDRMSDNGSYTVLVLVVDNCYWLELCTNTLCVNKPLSLCCEVWISLCYLPSCPNDIKTFFSPQFGA